MTLTEQRTAQDLEVRLATTDDEREAVYRFRYVVYVEELGRYRAAADHARRRLADPEDARSWLVYAAVAGEVVGSFRITWGGDGFSPRQIEQYQLAPFLAELPPEVMAVGERTMIAPSWRGTDLMAALGDVSEPISLAHDVRVVFGACEPHLFSFYAGLQRPYGTRNINSPEAGFLIPLVSFPQEADALREFGTDGRLPECVRRVLDSAGTVLSPLLDGREEYQRVVHNALGGLDGSVLGGLDDEQLDAVLRRSNVITCRAGDRLLKTGGSARNAFVVLTGSLAVSRDGTQVGTVGPGEIVGEMAYLLHQPRSFDVDVIDDGTRVLSLSERTLTTLIDVAPAAAARFTSNLARQLCRRLAPTSTAGALS
jgi:CRP-like cAMP-binding protein